MKKQSAFCRALSLLLALVFAFNTTLVVGLADPITETDEEDLIIVVEDTTSGGGSGGPVVEGPVGGVDGTTPGIPGEGENGPVGGEGGSGLDLDDEGGGEEPPPALDPVEVYRANMVGTYNLATGETEPGPRQRARLTGTLTAEWITGYNYPADYYLTGNFYLTGQWSRWYLNGELAYCLQPLNLNSTVGTVYSEIDFDALSLMQKDRIAKAMLHGDDGTNIEKHIVTQILIWEIALGQVNPITLAHVGVGGTQRSVYYMVDYYGLDALYDDLKAAIFTHNEIPSFMTGKRTELDNSPFPYMVPTDGTPLVLTDENGVLSDFDIEDGGGYTFTIVGDTLEVTATDSASDPYDPEVSSYTLIGETAPSVLAMGNGVEQIKGLCILDPAEAHFRVSITRGGGPPGGEINIVKVDDESVGPNHYSIHVAQGGASLAGAEFTIYADEDILDPVQPPVPLPPLPPLPPVYIYYEDDVVDVVYTDANGRAMISDLPPGRYRVTETDTPEGYLWHNYGTRGETKTITVGGGTGDLSFGDSVIKGHIRIQKMIEDTIDAGINDRDSDPSTKFPGAGIDFYIYLKDKLPAGWTVDDLVENKPDQSGLPVDQQALYMILTTNGQGICGTTMPETIKFARIGNVANSAPIAAPVMLPYGDYIIVEHFGDVTMPEGYIPEVIQMSISQHEKTYEYYLENKVINQRIQLYKIDADTYNRLDPENVQYDQDNHILHPGRWGIPLADTTFKIWDVRANKYISQTVTYPTPHAIEEFKTNAEGWVELPTRLKYGDYELHEITAPYGYYRDPTPLPFSVDDWRSDVVLEVEFGNLPQYGVIEIKKTGYMLTGKTDYNTGYGAAMRPEFTLRDLPGAVFEIFADEDIYTPDGTLRFRKDELVDTITSDVNGEATSKNLYLGKYRMKEKTAPYGYVLDLTVYNFELTYQGQDIDVYTVPSAHENIRQNVQFRVLKQIDRSGNLEAANNVVFGLYAREDLNDVDGVLAIPAGTLVEVITVRNGVGLSTYELPLGKYYLKELAAPAGVTFDPNLEYDIEFVYAPNEGALVTITANNGVAIKNIGPPRTPPTDPPGKKYGIIELYDPNLTTIIDPRVPLGNVPYTGRGDSTFGLIELGSLGTIVPVRMELLELYYLALALAAILGVAMLIRNNLDRLATVFAGVLRVLRKILPKLQTSHRMLSLLLVVGVVAMSVVPAFAATDAAPTSDEVQYDFVFTAEGEEYNYDAPKVVTVDGKTYALSNIQYEVLDRQEAETRLEEIVSFTGLTEETVPETYTTMINGKEVLLTLEDVTYTQETVSDAEVDLGWLRTQPAPDPQKEVTFTSAEGEVRTELVPLAKVEVVEEWAWVDTWTVTGAFVGGPDVDYFVINGSTYVVYNPIVPAWEGYERDIMIYLELDPDNHRIRSSKWTSDWTTDAQGRQVRQCEFSGDVLAAHWVAYYTPLEVEPIKAEATYSNGVIETHEAIYTIRAVATYIPQLPIPLGPLAVTTAAVVGVFILAWFSGPNVILYNEEGKRIGATRIRKGVIEIGKAKEKVENGPVTILVKKRYATHHIGEALTVNAGGSLVETLTIHPTVDSVTFIV